MARKPLADTAVVSRKYSITRLYWLGLVLLAAVPTLALGYFWVADQFATFREQSASLRHSYLQSREQYLRREAGEVFDYIDFKRAEIDQRLREDLQDAVGAALLALTPEAAGSGAASRQRVRALLKKVALGAGSDHLFLVDADGAVLLLPVGPDTAGRPADELLDAAGSPYLASVLAQARVQGEGFTAAWLPKPGGARDAYSAQVYLRFFPALNLYVGGIGYVEDRMRATQDEVLARFRAAGAGEVLLTIVDYDGRVVLPSRDASGGAASVAALSDGDGRALAPQLRAAIERPAGMLLYTRRPDPPGAADSGGYLQINYARAYPNWRWIIVTGFALRDLDATIARQHEEMLQRVQRRIAYVALAVLGLLALATLLAQRLSTRTRQALRQFNRAFEESSRSNTPIDIGQLSLLEFEPLAVDANRMLAYRIGIESELVNARLAAERASRAKSQFLATMSHELRTPLNGVLGCAQLLMRDPQLTPEQRRQLRSIESCGQQLLALINAVLDRAKIEGDTAAERPADGGLPAGAPPPLPLPAPPRGEALPAELCRALQAAIAEGDLEAMYAVVRIAEQRGFLSRQSLQRLRTLLDNLDLEAVRDWLAPAAEPF